MVSNADRGAGQIIIIIQSCCIFLKICNHEPDCASKPTVAHVTGKAEIGFFKKNENTCKSRATHDLVLFRKGSFPEGKEALGFRV